jgi:hypothetical protein
LPFFCTTIYNTNRYYIPNGSCSSLRVRYSESGKPSFFNTGLPRFARNDGADELPTRTTDMNLSFSRAEASEHKTSDFFCRRFLYSLYNSRFNIFLINIYCQITKPDYYNTNKY